MSSNTLDAGQDDFKQDTLTGTAIVESFDDDRAWDAVSGLWAINNGSYEQGDCNDVDATSQLIAGRPFADVRITTHFEVSQLCVGSHSQVMLLAHVYALVATGCNARYLVCAVDFGNQSLYAASLSNECVTYSLARSGLAAPDAFRVGDTLELVATVRGSTISCSVSGGTLSNTYTVAYTDGAFSAPGGVGLATYNVPVIFDDLIVEPL
ncbi:MAG: hypothetical protein JRH20_09795 [Deltaproteobacteria bacterium]|nr:hypothetical protein [Deltaproteobacteria bacterium]